MKDFLIRWGSFVLILFMLCGYQITLTNRTKDAEITGLREQIETMQTQSVQKQEAAKYRDGTFEGTGEGFGGEIRIQLTVASGEITDIRVLSAENEDSSYLSMAEGILAKMIDAQSAEVDTISGATYSSTGMKQAVSQALEQAEE